MIIQGHGRLGRARLTFKVGLRFRLVFVGPLNPVEAAAAVMEAATEVATAGMSAAEAATWAEDEVHEVAEAATATGKKN
jgi:hypothetical protein